MWPDFEEAAGAPGISGRRRPPGVRVAAGAGARDRDDTANLARRIRPRTDARDGSRLGFDGTARLSDRIARIANEEGIVAERLRNLGTLE